MPNVFFAPIVPQKTIDSTAVTCAKFLPFEGSLLAVGHESGPFTAVLQPPWNYHPQAIFLLFNITPSYPCTALVKTVVSDPGFALIWIIPKPRSQVSCTSMTDGSPRRAPSRRSYASRVPQMVSDYFLSSHTL